MALDPFPGGKHCRPRGLYDNLVDQNLGQAYRVVRFVYDNWDVVKLNYDLLVQLPPGVWTFDPTDYATAAQGLKADSAVQPGQVSAVGFSGQYADLFNKPVLGTASTRDTGYFATAQQGVLAENAIPNSEKGAANGVVPLGNDSKIAALFLPSYVDDVLEFASLSNFPASGEAGKIYVAIDSNLVYRWSGVTYIEISPSPGSTDAVAEGAVNKYFTEARVLAVAATTAQGAKADTAVQPAALTSALNTKAALPGAWTTVVGADLKNSWLDYGTADPSYNRLQYRRVDNLVEVRGLLRKDTAIGGSGEIMLTLPAGFRPAKNTILQTLGTYSALGTQLTRIDVAANGDMSINYSTFAGAPGSAVWIVLDGIRFYTE